MRRAPRRTSIALLGVVLVLLVAGVYQSVRRHEFTALDDRAFLVENARLRDGLTPSGVRFAFGSTLDGNWIPLTWLSFLIDEEIHGLSPAGTLATNAALHALSAVLLLLALFRLTGRPAPSAFAAAIFAVHPLHVESVAWAMERKDVLSGLLFHALLLGHAVYARGRSATRYLAVLALLLAGLLAKPMLVTAPFVLLLLDGWPLGRLGDAGARRRALLEKIPFLVAGLAVAALTLHTQRATAGLNLGGALPIELRLANAAVSYASYLGKALWPAELAVFYPHPRDALSPLRVAASLGLLAALFGFALVAWRRRPYLLVGWLWYLGMLVPVIGLVQVGEQALADRYTYLPLTGLAIALAWSADELAARRRALALPLAAAGVLAIGALAFVAARQVEHWRDGLSVFLHALAVTDGNAVAHNGAGFALIEQGRSAEALPHLERALELRPDLLDARVNLGIALMREGSPRAAVAQLEAGLRLPEPRRAPVYANLALASQQLGDPVRAAAYYREALALRPEWLGVLNNLAWLLVSEPELRDPHEAVRLAERAARGPGAEQPEILDTLSEAYAAAGRREDALRTAARGAALARQRGDLALARKIEERSAAW